MLRMEKHPSGSSRIFQPYNLCLLKRKCSLMASDCLGREAGQSLSRTRGGHMPDEEYFSSRNQVEMCQSAVLLPAGCLPPLVQRESLSLGSNMQRYPELGLWCIAPHTIPHTPLCVEHNTSDVEQKMSVGNFVGRSGSYHLPIYQESH